MSDLQRTTVSEFHHNGYRLIVRRIGTGGAYCAEITDTLGRHRGRDAVTCVDTTADAALYGLQDRIERSRLVGILWRDDALQVIAAHHSYRRHVRGW